MQRRPILALLWVRRVASATLLLAATALATDSPVGEVLLSDDFEADAPGAKPKNWGVFADKGNEATVVEAPAIGRRSVHFVDTGGTVWKPMIQGGISGQANRFMKLDFDWQIRGQADSFGKAFTVVLRGTGNVEVAAVAIGASGGVAVRQEGLGWVPLHLPLKTDRWNHLTLVADPISRGSRGAYSVIVTQGDDRMVFPNIPFCPSRGKVPGELWYSPCFSLAGSAMAGTEIEAWLDNVRLQVVADRRTWEK